MLDNEKLLFDDLYEKTKDCGRVQFVELLMTKERENKELKSQLAGTTFCYDEEEHRKLENNWNELKRWLYEDHCLYVPEIARNSTYQKVLEKMYEIEKESNSNEI